MSVGDVGMSQSRGVGGQDLADVVEGAESNNRDDSHNTMSFFLARV